MNEASTVAADSPGTNHQSATAAAITLSGLVKTYGDVRAVDGVDLTIRRGEVVALLGPNGAGKSTTVDIMLGLTRPDSGSARIFGEEPVKAVRNSRICAMLQEGTMLDDVTVRDIVNLVASLHKNPMPVDEALRHAGVLDIADRRSTKLSGGQKQRVRFATALVGNPEILVLDEPTAAMDVGTRREFWAAMREFTESGRTVVFATHYLDEAEEFADRVVLMRTGKVIADGTVAEVRSKASGRTLRARVPDSRLDLLRMLPGVADASARGDQIELKCTNSDAALQALLAQYPGSHDIEITAMGLEEAFLLLTADQPNENP